MSTTKLNDITWYLDDDALIKREPGIRHSFMSSLAATLNYISGKLDPAWLMGTSAFAFRIFINETMCPSAMSIFSWSAFFRKLFNKLGTRSDIEAASDMRAKLKQGGDG